MATKMIWYCKKCGASRKNRKLQFELLRDISSDKREQCPKCQAVMNCEVEFEFSLGVKDRKAEIKASYLPKELESWTTDERQEVVFYPFLVVLDRQNRGTSYWLPYWHTVDGQPRYGQWAPFMDQPFFQSLLEQARKDGFLR